MGASAPRRKTSLDLEDAVRDFGAALALVQAALDRVHHLGERGYALYPIPRNLRHAADALDDELAVALEQFSASAEPPSASGDEVRS